MPSQDGNQLSDASSTRRILTPPAEASQTSSDGALSGSRKRKRDGNTMEDLLKDPFAVKPYPSTVYVKPRTLHPLLLLPRSSLPLSSLDATPFPNSLPQSRLFESHVKILELEDRMGSQPVVLIARLDDGRSLYAVEREARGLYVLFHLGSWVDLRQLRAAAVVFKPDLSKATEATLGSAAVPQAAPLTTPQSNKYSKRKRLAIEAIQSMVKRPSTSLSAEPTPTETHLATAPPEPASDSPLLDASEPSTHSLEAPQPTANEIFENLRNQYFEALYLSKASLAYFAKGPLSRARAAFHLDYDSTLDMAEHIAFLESLIMSTTIIDKKYRDGVAGCVASISVLDQSADEAKQDAEKTKKRKTAKKMKPGKNGLYPVEDTLIRRWWATHDDEADLGAPGTSKGDLAKTRITQLRIRETQLQMIIILEVLALQPLVQVPEETDALLPDTLPQSGDSSSKHKTSKSKTLEHLSMLIDVHIDRLCIWQSIALETGKSPADGALAPGEKPTATTASVNSDNVLRDFCIEVILPFFAARLPERCATINRKLGGPVVASPPKPKLTKAASSSNLQSRPGAATKRPVPAKPRRSLQRVLTDDRERRNSVSHSLGRPISLMRSATAPIVPGLKREGSEAPSLGSIPVADAHSVQANRGGVLNSKRFSRREVDMSNLTTKVNAKKKAQINIEAELKDAISALKKPNRELAGKSVAEVAERRSASAPSARKSKKPVQNPLFHGVQITATPKANRRQDMFTGAHRSNVPLVMEDAETSAIPPSSLPRIPQSVTRPSSEDQAKNPLFAIQATPTRKSTSVARGGKGFLDVTAAESSYQPLTPLQPGRSSKQLFNLGQEAAVPQSSWSSQGVQETPAKQKSEAMLVHGHPILSTPISGKENLVSKGVVNCSMEQEPRKIGEDSIYKALGWDDADDIDDLA